MNNKSIIRFLNIAFILIFTLYSCQLNCENKIVVEAFGITSNDNKIKLDSNLYMKTEKIFLVITRVDNEIYETIISGNSFSYFKLNLDKKTQKLILEGFAENRVQKLSNQIKEIRKSDEVCNVIRGYYVNDSDKSNFCLLQSLNIKDIFNQNLDKNKVQIQDIKVIDILEFMYYKLNSLHWDYYMSSEYCFDKIRAYKEVKF